MNENFAPDARIERRAAAWLSDEVPTHGVSLGMEPGMSYRQWLAGLAMQGLLEHDTDRASDEMIARGAFALADAMIKEGVGPATFRFAEGRQYVNVCPDCRKQNGGGIEREGDSADESLSQPCIWCGKGPMVIRYLDEADAERNFCRGMTNEQLENHSCTEDYVPKYRTLTEERNAHQS